MARMLSDLVSATGVALLALVLFAHLALGQGIGPIKVMVLGFALAFLILASVTRRWLRVGLASSSVLYALLGSFAVYTAIDLQIILLDPIFKPIPALHLWELHERYGYGNRASISAFQTTREYAVHYSMDSDHCRISHSPIGREGQVLVLGDSFTFGQAVEDDETFSWRLAEDYWTQFRVRNCGVNGWGPAHAYLRLQEWLEINKDLPDLVLYTMISSDIDRSYIRKAWLEHVLLFHVHPDPASQGPGYHPHFELEDGQLTFKGLIDIGQALPDAPELRVKEIALTKALIVGMAELAQARGSEFAFVMLPQGNGSRLPPEVPEYLARAGVHQLDLSDRKAEVYERDRHPTPRFHAQLAAWIAESSISDLLP